MISCFQVTLILRLFVNSWVALAPIGKEVCQYGAKLRFRLGRSNCAWSIIAEYCCDVAYIRFRRVCGIDNECVHRDFPDNFAQFTAN